MTKRRFLAMAIFLATIETSAVQAQQQPELPAPAPAGAAAAGTVQPVAFH